MKVVVNRCFGGFGLSPKALLRLYELGADVATPVEEWKPKDTALQEWRTYLATGTGKGLFLTVFSLDEKYVLYYSNLNRDDPKLVQVVEELGDAANGQYAALEVVEIPDDIEWAIDEYDGSEHVEEVHRRW